MDFPLRTGRPLASAHLRDERIIRIYRLNTLLLSQPTGSLANLGKKTLLDENKQLYGVLSIYGLVQSGSPEWLRHTADWWRSASWDWILPVKSALISKLIWTEIHTIWSTEQMFFMMWLIFVLGFTGWVTVGTQALDTFLIITIIIII